MIKEGDLFLYTDARGDMPRDNEEKLGLYMKDTRFLHQWEWSLGEVPLRLLSAEADGAESLYRYTQEEGVQLSGEILKRDTIEISRRRRIYEGVLYETFTFLNRGGKPAAVPLHFQFDADFSDVFFIKGNKEVEMGEREPVRWTETGLHFDYQGTDGLKRSTAIQIAPAPDSPGEGGDLRMTLYLEPHLVKRVSLRILPTVDDETHSLYEESVVEETIGDLYREWYEASPEVESDSGAFDELYRRSLTDLRMLLIDLGEGPFPAAGLPWFGAPFGRDSLITALQSLPVNLEMAKNVVRTLARYQGKEVNPYREEEPGKILHEVRFGELAATEKIPHTPYYGSIDATPLYLILIAEVYRWTGDMDFVQEMLPSAQKALEWMNTFGDPGNLGYTAFYSRSEQGLAYQGWKYSKESVIHEDGGQAKPPIALAEVQGYVYWAKRSWSDLFHHMGNIEESRRLSKEAEALRTRFRRDFWVEEEGYPAIALDGEKKRVETVSSNPAHCLAAGMFNQEEAFRVARRLFMPDLFSGWGIRTLSSEAGSYNPFSVHNGSVWPHDNSLILLGLKKMGFHDESDRLIIGLLEAAACFPGHRLPEFFCGYGKDEGSLVPYPAACSPQAWAAGTGFAILQAILGIVPDAARRKLYLSPRLPEGINRLTIRRLKAGQGSLDLKLSRVGNATYAQLTENTTGWSVILST
ncbi:amylo-alpha-1,6-glucosidase [Salinithrix halophila]|uniref:Glycogen debranching N-terminal domain-containing protein n=1 Tax=Salinithrix halophila TaxID=1485204 RepID=A0ABV8JAS5_9BACL